MIKASHCWCESRPIITAWRQSGGRIELSVALTCPIPRCVIKLLRLSDVGRACVSSECSCRTLPCLLPCYAHFAYSSCFLPREATPFPAHKPSLPSTQFSIVPYSECFCRASFLPFSAFISHAPLASHTKLHQSPPTQTFTSFQPFQLTPLF